VSLAYPGLRERREVQSKMTSNKTEDLFLYIYSFLRINLTMAAFATQAELLYLPFLSDVLYA
jgi:hypothetical protein